MRRLLRLIGCVGLVAASCARPVDIVVAIDDSGFLATVRPSGTSCTCNGGFADVDTCVSGTDTIQPCTCDDGSSVLGCVSAVHLESQAAGTQDLGPIDEARKFGAFGGAAHAGDVIVFEGCGDPLRVAIPDAVAPSGSATTSVGDGGITLKVDTDAALVTACSSGGFSGTCCGHSPGSSFTFPLAGKSLCGLQQSISFSALVDERSTSAARARVFREGHSLGGAPCVPSTDADGLLSCEVCRAVAHVGQQAGVNTVHFDPAVPSHVRVDAGSFGVIDVDGDLVTVTGANGIIVSLNDQHDTVHGSARGAVLTGGPVVLGAYQQTELVLQPIVVTLIDDNNAASSADLTVSFDVDLPPVAVATSAGP